MFCNRKDKAPECLSGAIQSVDYLSILSQLHWLVNQLQWLVDQLQRMTNCNG